MLDVQSLEVGGWGLEIRDIIPGIQLDEFPQMHFFIILKQWSSNWGRVPLDMLGSNLEGTQNKSVNWLSSLTSIKITWITSYTQTISNTTQLLLHYLVLYAFTFCVAFCLFIQRYELLQHKVCDAGSTQGTWWDSTCNS